LRNGNNDLVSGGRPGVRTWFGSLRARLLAPILAAVLLADLLAVWAVTDRLQAGVRRETDNPALGQLAQVRAKRVTATASNVEPRASR
jgi:hypothetical protein